MHRCVISFFVLSALLANQVCAQTTAGIPWAGTVRDGLKQALINQKQILLYFHAPELAVCSSVEQQVLGNADVQQTITANFIPVKINVREVPATARFYQANDDSQLPRVIILSADEKVISRFTANTNPSDFVNQLKSTANNSLSNPKLEQTVALAKTASSFLSPTAEPTAQANATLAANIASNKPATAVMPTAWQPGTQGSSNNALLLPEFAPQNTAAATPTAATNKTSLLPPAVGPLARTATNDVTFGGTAPTMGAAVARTPGSSAMSSNAPAIPSLANYGMTGVTTSAAPVTPAAPMGYGMQNLAATAQPYQQQAQQAVTQLQNTANQTIANGQAQASQLIANAQTQATQQINSAQQQITSAQQNLQNNLGNAVGNFASSAPAVGSFYDAGLSPRPSATQGANLATVPGLGVPASSTNSMPVAQPSGSPYSLGGSGSVAPAVPAVAATVMPAPATTPTTALAPTNYALAPGASYGIPNNAPATPALPGHPKEKAGLANYSTDNLQGYLGNGSKPVLPSAQVNSANAINSAANSPTATNTAAANPNPGTQQQSSAAVQIGLQGHCPVTISEQHKWTKGDPQFGAMHRGKTYLFASAAEQQKFLANPDKYTPVIGGNDPVVMYHEGRYIAGTPALGAMYKKRMYLFSTPAAKAEFESNPNKYEQAVSMAETQAGIIVR